MREHGQAATAAPAHACKHAARPGRPTAAAAPLDACARGCATADAARSPPGGPSTSPGQVLDALHEQQQASMAGHDQQQPKVEDDLITSLPLVR